MKAIRCLIYSTVVCLALINQSFGEEPRKRTHLAADRRLSIEENVKRDFQERLLTLRKEIDNTLDKYNLKLEKVNLSVLRNEKAIDNHVNLLSLFAGSVIGLAALFLGIGLMKFYFDSKRLTKMAKEKLDSEFSIWWKGRESEMSAARQALMRTFEDSLFNYTYFLKLKALVLQGNVDPEEVFPLITPLCDCPELVYKPVFEKLLTLCNNEEIAAKANEALRRMPR